VDATLLAAAWRAVDSEDEDALARTSELAAAFRGTAEGALESAAQGAAFVEAVRAAWADPAFMAWAAEEEASGRPAAYAVAAGVAAAAAGVPLIPAAGAFLHGLTANLVSAGLRLVPLGQTDGQKALAALEAPVLDAARAASSRSLDALGTATAMVEWTSMGHETQYTRLFRS